MSAVANAPVPGPNGAPRGTWTFTLLSSVDLAPTTLAGGLSVVLMGGDGSVLDVVVIEPQACKSVSQGAALCKIGTKSTGGNLCVAKFSPSGSQKITGSFKKRALEDAGTSPLRVVISTDTGLYMAESTKCHITKAAVKAASSKTVKTKVATPKSAAATRNAKQRCT